MSESLEYNRLLQHTANADPPLGHSIDFQESLKNLVSAVADIFDAKACLICRLDPLKTETRVLAAAGLEKSTEKIIEMPETADIPELRRHEPVFIENAAADIRVSGLLTAAGENICSVMGLPFSVAQDMTMILWLCFDRALSGEETNPRLQRAVCIQGAATVKNAIQQTRYLETFRKISAAIHQGEQADDILKTIVENIQEIMEARGCIYWIVDTNSCAIHMKATSGFQMENLSRVSYEMLEEVFEFHDEKDIYFEDVRGDPRIPSTTTLGKQMVTSILGIPFPIAEPYRGILAVYFSRPRPLLESEIEFVRASGRQGAIALHKAFRYDEKMLKAFRETIEGLVLALEAKDMCTHGHSLNVANYAHMTAMEMGLGEKEADTIYHAGLLHDIGKIAMDDTILANLGNLMPGDMETIKKHPVIGAHIIAPLSSLANVADLIRSHHERYNGTGYPEGLIGEAIPMGARIIAVTDSFDAMTSQRPGTQTVGVKKAMSLLLEQAGTTFDPEVVRSFVRAIEKNPDAVTPFTLTEDYLSQHARAFADAKKQGSPLSRMLKKCVPGF